MSMRNALLAAGAVAAALGSSSAQAQGTVKIGVILPYSGQFADTGNQLDNGIKLYIKQNGDSVAGKKIEVIRKDVGGIAPDVAKHAQRARRRRRLRRGEEIHGGHAGGDLDHHHQVALHGAGVVHDTAVERYARRLGLPQRPAQGLFDGGGFRPGT
jgi:hypothetical protein